MHAVDNDEQSVPICRSCCSPVRRERESRPLKPFPPHVHVELSHQIS